MDGYGNGIRLGSQQEWFTGEIEELMSILQNVLISIDCRDVWRWNARDDGKYMVKTLTKMVEEKNFE
nr:hypothetical protein [Tanacetum cinerariifolium]